ncbi:MAG: BatD family protein [Thermoanaerobaculia bacterium]|nr:BatD family protein [Thermoanaerobaculia bacterium]
MRGELRSLLLLVPVPLLGLGVGLTAQAQPDRDRADSPIVSASIYPEGDIGVDEVVQLKIEVTLNDDADVKTPLMDLENLKIVGGPGQSNQIIFSSGVTRRIVSFTYHVRPEGLGLAVLRGGYITIGGKAYELPEARSAAVEEAPPRRSARRRDPFGNFFDQDPLDPFGRRPNLPDAEPPKIFLEAVVEPARPWVGQQAIYTVYLYTDVAVRSVTVSDIPEFPGFWALPLERGDDLDQRVATRDGRRLNQVKLMQRVVFPRRGGELEIGPTEVIMAVVERGRSFFSGPGLREMRRRSNRVTVKVKPLPDSAPESYGGAVGDLTLRADIEPRDLSMGDAATLTLVLDGRGHLQGVPAPEIPTSDAYEIFPPQQQSHEEIRGELVYGTRTWSYVVVPKQTGAVEVPTVRMPYFDPRRSEYRIAETEPLRLAVRGATQATQDSGRTIELHPIRTSALPDVGGSARGVWPARRHGLFALPIAAALVLFLLRRQGLAPGSARAAQRKQLLESLSLAADEDKPRQVAAGIEDAWRDYLASRWSVPRGTPSNQWSRIMTTHGASRDAAEELVALADDLHYLRYAPKLSSTEEMQRELVERSRRLARRLG